jgi:hypothetical protein
MWNPCRAKTFAKNALKILLDIWFSGFSSPVWDPDSRVKLKFFMWFRIRETFVFFYDFKVKLLFYKLIRLEISLLYWPPPFHGKINFSSNAVIQSGFRLGWSTKFLCREISRNIYFVFREIIFYIYFFIYFIYLK